MKDEQSKYITDLDETDSHEDSVNILLKAAGPRIKAARESTQRIHDQLFTQWQGAVRRRRQRQRSLIISLSSAAAVIIGLVVLWSGLVKTTENPVAVVAVAERIAGSAYVYTDIVAELEEETQIFPGQTIRTAANSGLALRLNSNQSLRLDQNTELAVLGYRKFELLKGAIYFDSLGAKNTNAIEIYTPAGIARDIGTQFEVRVDKDLTRVRVRNGQVSLTQQGFVSNSEHIDSNEELTIAQGRSERGQISSSHEDWEWAKRLAPTFVLEGSNLHDFLSWISRESGWTLLYAKPELEQRAKKAILHGSIDGLSMEDALVNVTQTSNVEYQFSDDILLFTAIAID